MKMKGRNQLFSEALDCKEKGSKGSDYTTSRRQNKNQDFVVIQLVPGEWNKGMEPQELVREQVEKKYFHILLLESHNKFVY
eukprot:scaffold6315_cov116-Cylindrotheca_fusiformis.AAC.10